MKPPKIPTSGRANAGSKPRRSRPSRRKAAAGLVVLAGVIAATTASILSSRPVLAPSSKNATHVRALENPLKDATPSPNFATSCPGDQLDAALACLTAIIGATTHARHEEGVRPLSFDTASYRRLSTAEQLFVLVNLERTARGLAPFTVLSTQLDAIALTAAQSQVDPRMGANPSLVGSGPVVDWGGNWGGNTYSAAGSNYIWMYEDGPGSYNVSCTPSTPTSCWGHRENILSSYGSSAAACAGRPVVLAMGAAEAPSDGADPLPSFTELLTVSCGHVPTSVKMTWAAAQALLGMTAA